MRAIKLNSTGTGANAIRVVGVGHAVFAAAFVGIGILGLIHSEFVAVWNGVPRDLPVHHWLPRLCAVVSLACGLGLVWRRTAVPASRVLLGFLLLWFLAFKLRFVAHAPLVVGSWEGVAPTAVIVAGAWVLHAWLGAGREPHWLGFATGASGVRIARVVYGLCMIVFGLAHFAYLDLTAPLVPDWLPGHVFWAYFTGAAYIAAGIAMLVGVCARLAATLSAVQMGLLTVLVWIPILAAGDAPTSQVGEFVVSCVLTASGWVMADTYRGLGWLSLRPGRQAVAA
jgi:uncharacterized membrane protein